MITDVNTKYQLSNTPRTSRRNIEKLRKPKNASGRLRQTQKQTERRQAGRQTDNTDKQSRYTDTQRHGHIGRQTDKQTRTVQRDIHTNREDI